MEKMLHGLTNINPSNRDYILKKNKVNDMKLEKNEMKKWDTKKNGLG